MILVGKKYEESEVREGGRTKLTRYFKIKEEEKIVFDE